MSKDTQHTNEPACKGNTFGDRAFDIFLYGGVGTIGNLAMSIAFQAAFEKTSIGQRMMNDTTGLFQKAGKVVMGKESFGAVDHMVSNTFMTSGDFAIVVPLKILEDHRSEIVDKINSMFGSKQPPVYGPDGKEVKNLEDCPKQTWKSMGIGALSSVAVIWPLNLAVSGLMWKHMEGVGEAVNKLLHLGIKLDRTKGFLGQQIVTAAVSSAVIFGVSRFISNSEFKKSHPPSPDNAFIDPSERPQTEISQASHVGRLEADKSPTL